MFTMYLQKGDNSTTQLRSLTTSTPKKTDDSSIHPTSAATSTQKVTDDSITQPTTSAISIPKKTDWPTTEPITDGPAVYSTGKTASKTAKNTDQPTIMLRSLYR